MNNKKKSTDQKADIIKAAKELNNHLKRVAEVYAGLNTDGEMDSTRYFAFMDGAEYGMQVIMTAFKLKEK